MKKLIKFLILIIALFGLYAVINLVPKNYTYKYKIKKYNITEKYDKKKKIYSFTIKKGSDLYEYNVQSKYYTNRGLLKKTEIKDDCLSTSSYKLKDYHICKKDEEYYTKYYDKTEDSKKNGNYEKIDIYNTLDKTYLIWNYNYFVAISPKKNSTLDLFEDDFYNLGVVTTYNGKLVVPDYNSKYTFEKLYIINPKNLKYEELELDRKIYFNSYFLGEYKKYLYLYDLQKKQEYKIDMKDGTVYKNKPELLIGDKFEDTTINKLNKKNIVFSDGNSFYYELKDQKLIYNMNDIKINVTNIRVDNLVQSDNEDAYFISGDTLYYANIDKGITKLLSYNEWNFNNSNIYIFD